MPALSCALMLLIAPAASALDGLLVFGAYRDYTWEEPNFDVKEDGPLYGIGAEFEVPIEARGFLLLSAEGWGGQVRYDGALQDFTPYESKTSYLGLQMDALYGYDVLPADGSRLAPVFGLGSRAWRRRIDDIRGNENTYDEDWSTSYLTAGVRLETAVTGEHRVFAHAQAHHIFHIEEEVNLKLEDRDTINLEPDPKTGYTARIGWAYREYRAALFYEAWTFDKSEIEAGFFQPDSESRAFGIMVGTAF